ncbi:hypothetical protein M0804_010587, partial [Polistes exclamans]
NRDNQKKKKKEKKGSHSNRILFGVTGPRGAVGGCSTPGSRVDPWWNSGPLFPSPPGPSRIDEGLADNFTSGFQFCIPSGSRNNSNVYHNQSYQQQEQHQPQQQHQQQQQQQQQQQHHHHQQQQQLHHRQYQVNRNTCSSYGIASTSSSVCSTSGLGHTQNRRGADAVGSSSSSIAYGINSSSPETSSTFRNNNNNNNNSNNNNNNNNSNLVLAALLAPTSVIGCADRLSNCEISVSHGNVIGSINNTTTNSTTAESLNGVYSPLTLTRRTEESSRVRSEEVSNASLSSASDSLSTFSTSNLNTSLLSSLLSTSSISSSPCRGDNNEEELITRTCMRLEEDQQSREQNPVHDKIEYTLAQVSQESLGSEENEDLTVALPYEIIAAGRRQVRIPSGSSVISPSGDIVLDMKYETQTGPSTVPPHLTSTGVEPPHSSQGSGIIGGSEAEEVGVDNLLLSSWGATGSDYLESSDIKQNTVGLQDSWDTLLLGTTVEVTSVQSLAELKPLPPFTGYTGHLSINGISGHHYHTIASSAQSQSGTEEQPITDISKDWIDIADWIQSVSPKAQVPAGCAQIYASTPATTQIQQQASTLQSLLTHAYSPLLHARLQSGNPGMQNASCGETPSSTSPFPPVSPPGRVSTSCSPDLLHSSFAAPSHPRKRSRPGPGSQNTSKKNLASSTGALTYGSESGLIGGKEKPVHRCSICNRGFLNKSNIKVHLRTHTGEKPFRCDVCGKAFRQKAHLIKHQQIHKRIGRD